MKVQFQGSFWQPHIWHSLWFINIFEIQATNRLNRRSSLHSTIQWGGTDLMYCRWYFRAQVISAVQLLKCGFRKKSFIMNTPLVSCAYLSSLLGGYNSKPTQKWWQICSTDYSHLSNKREVTLTDFEKFHPPKKKSPSTFIDFLNFFHPPLLVYYGYGLVFSKKSHPPCLFQPRRLVIWQLLHPLQVYFNLHVY